MHFCVSVFHKAVLSQKHYSYMALENKASFDGNTSAKNIEIGLCLSDL